MRLWWGDPPGYARQAITLFFMVEVPMPTYLFLEEGVPVLLLLTLHR